jgi:hypothetical protein
MGRIAGRLGPGRGKKLTCTSEGQAGWEEGVLEDELFASPFVRLDPVSHSNRRTTLDFPSFLCRPFLALQPELMLKVLSFIIQSPGLCPGVGWLMFLEVGKLICSVEALSLIKHPSHYQELMW